MAFTDPPATSTLNTSRLTFRAVK
nr:unnamed protein product [Callosobruchus analis]CAI5859974.1 unnamed protein product [Callosobruchus analis]